VKPADIVVTSMGARFMGRMFPCTVGRGGVTTQKREGDGGTPAGTHNIVGMLYRPDRIARTALPDWAVPIGLGDFWSEDPTDPDYNLLVRTPHRFGHECLRRADPLYDLILLTNWNWPYAVPGRGSAIFVHRWRRPGYPTAGCIGLAPGHLLWIANRIRHQTRLIVQA
jgi:L,D-peptidoglycan transpeptidase YkuD (ErfK/YbiS/YcfS/YnhG family)